MPLGLAFDEAEEASWLLIDDAMKVLAGTGSYGIREPNPATRFHLWVYRARNDVAAIVHTHPPATSVLAAAEQPLVVAHMDATPLFDDIAFLPDWPGLPTADREGELIAGGLGTSTRCCSPTMACSPPDAACRRRRSSPSSSSAWRGCRSTPRRSAASRPIDAAEARRARDFLRTDRIMDATFDAWSRRAARRRGRDGGAA